MKVQLKLTPLFALLLSIIFIAGTVISGVALYGFLNQQAQDEVQSQAGILLQAMNSVRNYTSTRIDPLLAKTQATQSTFMPETVPAFSASQTFARFRQTSNYDDFVYKEAATNPTSPQDKADDFEAQLLERMRNTPNSSETSGYRTMPWGSVFYVARPMTVTSTTCLPCHSTPEAAPKGMLDQYGSSIGGFGWKPGDVIATQIIYVPADKVQKSRDHSFWLVMGIFIVIFAVVIVLLNFLLQRYVIQAVSILARLAQKISADQMASTDIESPAISRVTTRADELGQLAQVFQGMAREVYTRTEGLRHQVQELRIVIDEMRRKQQVAAIVENDSFRDLQAKAQEMKQRRNAVQKSNPPPEADEIPAKSALQPPGRPFGEPCECKADIQGSPKGET